MSSRSRSHSLVVPVSAIVGTSEGGAGLYVNTAGPSLFVFVSVRIVEQGLHLMSADGEEQVCVSHPGQVSFSAFDVCDQPAVAQRQLLHLLLAERRRQLAAPTPLTESGLPRLAAPKGKQTPWWNSDDMLPRWPRDGKHVMEARLRLSQWSFDAFAYSKLELACLLLAMADDLQLPHRFGISRDAFARAVYQVRAHCHDNPYHCFRRTFDVAQCVYLLVRSTPSLRLYLAPFDVLVLFVAALAHGLDHPGLTNEFLCETRSEAALVYNHTSVLEHHHCATAFRLLNSADVRLFEGFSRESYAELRAGVIACVLGTDHGAASHQSCVSELHAQLHARPYAALPTPAALPRLHLQTRHATSPLWTCPATKQPTVETRLRSSFPSPLFVRSIT